MGLIVAPHKAAVRIQCVIALGQALGSCVIEAGWSSPSWEEHSLGARKDRCDRIRQLGG